MKLETNKNMYKQNLNLLILEDNPIDAKMIVTKLESEGFVLEWKRVETEKAFKKAVAEKPEIILADYELPLYNGLSAIKLQQQIAPGIPLILVSGIAGEDIAVECMKTGAIDYVLKNRLSRLGFVVKRALKEAEAYRERKKTEDALKKSEKKYRTLTENLNVGIFRNTLGPKGKFIEMNPALIKMFGYKSKEEVLKLNVSDLYQNPEERKNFNRQILKNGFVKDEDLNLIKKDGSALIGSVSAVAVKDKNGNMKFYDGIIEDITERKQAEEDLKQSEQKYCTMVENIQDGVFLIQDEKLKFVNEAFAKISGYTVKKIIGMDFCELVAPEDLDMVKDRYHRMMAGEDMPREYEFRGIRKDSNERTIVYMNVGLINYQGKKAAMGTLKDITERRKMEEAMRESEEKYRTLIENIEEGIGIVDENEKFVFVNRAASIIFGHPENKILNKTLKDFTTPNEFKKIIEQTSVRKKGKPGKYELNIIKKDETHSVISITASPLFDDNNNYKGTHGIFHDITERKKAEKALHESEERYRAIVEQSNDAIYIYRGDKFLFINDRVCEITGYTKDVLYELNMWSLLHPDDRERIMEIGRQRAKGKKVPSIYEARIVRMNGDIRQCEFRVRIISYNGKYAAMGAVRDVTENRKAQDELKKYAETQEALLREVNHRVKNNLTAILGLLGMEEARTENKVYSSFINKFKGRISGLSAIHSLLSESGWLSLKLSHLCEQVIKSSVSCLPNSNLINFNVSPSEIIINSNQAHHLTLVINELITNSIKHGQNYKNKIYINIDSKKDKKNVIITYKDTGKGYPQEFIDGNFSNIGVGFELIKGIVTHSLRGELQIYNDNGALTVIIFELERETYI